MKLGVICDGIGRDLGHALGVMDEFGLEHAELQFVGEKEIGDHGAAELAEIRALLGDRGKSVSCLSRHVFAGLTVANRPGDAEHARHMAALGRVMDAAHELGAPLVRVLSPKKEQILFGSHGAEKWNVAHGAWDATLALIAPAVELARAEGLTLVVETGNGTMVNSAWTARRLVDELGAKDVLKVLWDPANACWCHELAHPDGYAALAGGYLGHVHVKDVLVDTPRATLEVRALGDGQLGPLLAPIAAALDADGYEGVVSLESVYHPGTPGGRAPTDADFEAGFRRCVGRFKALFGDG